MSTPVEIRPLTTHDEFAEAVRLQREIWGFQEVELLPVRLFVVASKIGGQVLGAFDGKQMVAFCFCIPGLKQGAHPYLHSHMLGVLPQYRNTGLGRRMKWKQREFALLQSIELIEWTFDPLEIKNAFFNIERLGAIVRRLVRNQYGSTTSHLHGGLPTDRLIAEWWLRSARVEDASHHRSHQTILPLATVAVPSDIAEIRRTDRGRAREIQARITDQFDQHFQKGLAVTGFSSAPPYGTYLLGEWEFV
jgi:predicted GNAT superfamily acetyltransferase